MNRKTKSLLNSFLALGIVVFGGAYAVVSITQWRLENSQKLDTPEQAMAAALGKNGAKDSGQYLGSGAGRQSTWNRLECNVKDTLPEITKYPLQVEGTALNNVEIFSFHRKSGHGHGWAGLWIWPRHLMPPAVTVNGAPVSVSIRGIASGLACDYISFLGQVYAGRIFFHLQRTLGRRP